METELKERFLKNLPFNIDISKIYEWINTAEQKLKEENKEEKSEI